MRRVILAVSVAFAFAVVPTAVRADDPLYFSAPNGLPPGCNCVVVGAPQAVPVGPAHSAPATGTNAAGAVSDGDDLASDAPVRKVGPASAAVQPRDDDSR